MVKRLVCILLVFSMLLLPGCCLSHEYAPATCTEPETCVKCGKTNGNANGHSWIITSCTAPKTCSICGAIGEARGEHRWLAYSLQDTIECSYCDEIITAESVKAKKGNNLARIEKAFIYMWLDYYLTATGSNGRYLYSEKQAFQTVEDKFGVTKQYLDNNIWNGHARDAYVEYYS